MEAERTRISIVDPRFSILYFGVIRWDVDALGIICILFPRSWAAGMAVFEPFVGVHT
jgi:hypothetical protein